MISVKNLSTGQSATAQEGELLREVAQREDLGIPFGCENGLCSTCLIQIGKGLENLGEKTEQEQFTLEARDAEPTMRLACQCTVHGDVEFEQ